MSLFNNKLQKVQMAMLADDVQQKFNSTDATLAQKAAQADLNTTNANVALKADKTDLNTQKSRIDNLVQTSSSSFYQKSTSGTTGSLLVVSSGATTGQINLANVTPVATGYTPVVGDYVLLVYGVASGTAELVDGRTINGYTYSNLGNALRSEFIAILNRLQNLSLNTIPLTFTEGSFITTSGSLSANNNFGYTSPIQIKKGQKISLFGQGYVTNVAMISTCNSDGTNIKPVINSIDSTERWYSYTAKADCYVILCCTLYDHSGSTVTKVYNPYALTVDVTDNNNLNSLLQLLNYSQLNPTFNALGNYISSTGSVISDGGSNQFYYSQPISLKKGYRLKANIQGYLGNVAIISTCNSDGTNIKPAVISQDGVSAYEYVAKSDCYIIISGNANSNQGIYSHYFDNKEDDSNNLNQLLTLLHYSLLNLSFNPKGTYISSIGVIQTDGGANQFYYSQPFLLKKGYRLVTYIQGYLSNVAIVSTCNSDGSNIVPVVISKDGVGEYSYTAKTDCYVIVSGNANYFNGAYSYFSEQYTDNNNLDDEFYKSLFGSSICIGDSITAGYRKTGYTDANKSYPAFLGKMSGWNITNAGVSGITTLGWWQNQKPNYNFANYDIAIIKLGQNGGLTDTIVADTSSGDYNTYADTNTGRYCSIIESIHAQNTKAKIFLIPVKNYDSTGQAINAIIQKIAAKYSYTYFIDINNNPWWNLDSGVYHTAADGTSYDVHFNTVGYLYLAKTIFQLICDNISTNTSAYTDY